MINNIQSKLGPTYREYIEMCNERDANPGSFNTESEDDLVNKYDEFE